MDRYEGSLGLARSYYNDPDCFKYIKSCLADIFPELAESEDERIRKDIIILVKDWWDRVNKDNISTKEEMLAWLEKQKSADEQPLILKDGTQSKQAWNEKDETLLTNTIILLKEGAGKHFSTKDVSKCVEWLKSLHPQKLH